MTQLRQRMIQKLRELRYPSLIRKVYIDHVADYAKFFMQSPHLLGPQHVNAYQRDLIERRKVAAIVLGDVVAALRFFYKIVLGVRWDVEPIPGAALSLRQRMLEDMRSRNFSPKTQYYYLDHVTRLAKYFRKSPHLLGPEHLRQYMVYLCEEKGASVQTRRAAVCGLRFFYKTTLRRSWMLESIPYPKRPKKLPEILSPQEVQHFLSYVKSIKYRAIILIAYAGGLRLSEILHLKIRDIDSQRMVIRIRQGKGLKDRDVMLSENLHDTLRAYYKAERPPGPFLFPGMKPGEPLDRHTIQNVFREARKRSGIKKKFSIHTLRHCFATHLIEAGTDIRSIQLLLGHRCLSSTQIYTHLAKTNVCAAKSPLDLFFSKGKSDSRKKTKNKERNASPKTKTTRRKKKASRASTKKKTTPGKKKSTTRKKKESKGKVSRTSAKKKSSSSRK